MLIKFLIVCLLVVTQNVAAVEVNGLYDVEVVAQSQSRKDRNTALRNGLMIVFKRFLTSEAITKDKVIKEALNHAADYADQYQYALVSDSKNSSTSRVMRIAFNETTIMTLMRRSGLPIWNEMRDELLLWVVIEDQGKKQVFDATSNSLFLQIFKSAAALKGIPILFPLMDLEEQQAITPKEILSAYPDQLIYASKRYDVPAILSGKLVHEGRCWRSEWTLNFNNKVQQWKAPCSSVETNLTSVFDQTFDRLSTFYAVESTANEITELGIETLSIKIVGLKNKHEVRAVSDYLKSLATVKSVIASPLKYKRCVFEIKTTGSPEKLKESIILSRYLREKGLNRDNSVLYELVKK